MSMQFRPTFSIPIESDTGNVFSRIKVAVSAQPEHCTGQFRTGHGLISIAESNRHFWSPWLHLHVMPSDPSVDDSPLVLFGRFSPHPSIWTAVMFSYLALSVIVFFLMVIGTSQILAREYPWGLALIPVCGVLALVLWLVSQAGQRLAHDEMVMLKQLVETSVSTSSADPIGSIH